MKCKYCVNGKMEKLIIVGNYQWERIIVECPFCKTEGVEMKIFIEHTDGKFYHWTFWDFWENISDYTYDKDTLTDTRDFPIGSRVYFQGIGWTEVSRDHGGNRCINCALDRRPVNCNIECITRIFKKLKEEETKMNKVYFENEEEFEKFMDDCYVGEHRQRTAEIVKEKGYIKKSVVEEAEDMYAKLGEDYESADIEIIVKQHHAIQHLKQKLSEATK